jgi:hypothetical protein
MVMGKTPAVPEPGVPLSNPVPVLKVIPDGSGPDSDRVGVGDPVAVIVNDPGTPTVKVALFALVMAGAWFTVRVKFCVASAPTPLCAVNVMV